MNLRVPHLWFVRVGSYDQGHKISALHSFFLSALSELCVSLISPLSPKTHQSPPKSQPQLFSKCKRNPYETATLFTPNRPTSSPATRRASASAASTSSIDPNFVFAVLSNTLSITSAIPKNASRPSRNAATATSSAAFNAHGQAPPFFIASRASRKHGNLRVEAVSKSSRFNFPQSNSTSSVPTPPGYVSASCTATRISVGPNCASTDPSTYSTIE